MKKILAIVLSLVMAFSMMSISAFAATPVAKLGDDLYASLQLAIDDSVASDTITLVADVEENVTIGKSIIINGDGYDYTGTMTLNRVSATIENVNFVAGNIYKNKKTGVGYNFTIRNCNFDGQGMNNYAINLGGTSSIIIEDCTAKNYGYGMLQVPATNNSVLVKNVEVSNVNYGFKIDYSNGVTMENVTITDCYVAGILNSNYGAKTITLEDCKFDIENPIKIWERAAAKETTFHFKGQNYFGDEPLDFGSDLVKLSYDCVKIGDETYETLKEAVAAAKSGDVITLIGDSALTAEDVDEKAYGMYPLIAVTDKEITIDLNGKKITVADLSLDANLLAVFYACGTGAITLTDSSEEKTGTVDVTLAEGTEAYSMFTALDAGAKMSIEGGNYSIDRIKAGQSMIYSDQNKQITVSGGDFVIGNAGTKDTGTPGAPFQPWMFNAEGDGVKAIVVTGGSYNIDPTHYHGETYFPDCYYVVKTAADEYSVVLSHTEGAAATCQAAQTCTVCGTELDAIKDHSLGEYVSDNNATCEADGTKTASCVYGCGLTDTITDEGTKKAHTPGAAATCQAAQICTVCGTELDAIKDHSLGEYASDNNATCEADGTKTASCVYGCGLTDTVADEGTRQSHTDADNDRHCDYCNREKCTVCGGIHETFLSEVICVLTASVRLIVSFFETVF